MIFNLNKSLKIIKRNTELVFLLLLVIIAVASTTFYNNKKIIINENYKNVINNIYFKKSISHIFNNLTSRYKNIEHEISQGETFDKILSNHSVPSDEIIKIKKDLIKISNLNIFKTGLKLKFTIDESNKKKITSFTFPLSRTEKIKLTRVLETDLFEKKKNYYKFK